MTRHAVGQCAKGIQVLITGVVMKLASGYTNVCRTGAVSGRGEGGSVLGITGTRGA